MRDKDEASVEAARGGHHERTAVEHAGAGSAGRGEGSSLEELVASVLAPKRGRIGQAVRPPVGPRLRSRELWQLAGAMEGTSDGVCQEDFRARSAAAGALRGEA
jgi:hypothetical protein